MSFTLTTGIDGCDFDGERLRGLMSVNHQNRCKTTLRAHVRPSLTPTTPDTTRRDSWGTVGPSDLSAEATRPADACTAVTIVWDKVA